MPISRDFVANDLDYLGLLNELADALMSLAAVQTTNFTAASGYIYPLGTDGLVVTLPATPSAGWRIKFFSKNSTIKSVTFGRNGSNIDSVASDASLSGNDTTLNVELVYVDGTVGWRIIKSFVSGGFEVKTTGFTAVKEGVYVLDASSFTVTAPASPVAGDRFFLLASTEARTSITIGRNSSNINSVAADYVISGYQWAVEVLFVNSTVGWLVITYGIEELLGRWDSTNKMFRYHDGQRELAAPSGWCPVAIPLGNAHHMAHSTAGSLAASGGTALIPILVTAHMLVHRVTVREGSTTLLRQAEWRLYKQKMNNGNSSENTLDEIPGANGTWSWTATVASNQTSTPTTQPFYLSPGIYWIAIRNTHASNIFALNNTAQGNMAQNAWQTKTLGSALGATLDAVAATWTKQATCPAVALEGRVFGQTTVF